MSPRLIVTEIGVERLCNRCGEYWPLDDQFYYRQKKGCGGFMGLCKACFHETRDAKRAA